MNETQLKVMVVNMARSVHRRDQMKAVLSPLGISYEFFDAIDGKAGVHPLFDHVDQRLAEIRRGFILTDGEIGCFASHYLLWELSAKENVAILIFEDDVAINANFQAAFAAAAAHIDRLGLIRFSGHKEREFTQLEKLADGLDIVRFTKGPNGTSCYAVSPYAARKLLAKAAVWFEPVDLHLDRFWTHGVDSLGILPYPVTHEAETAEQSEIWQGAKRAPKSRRYRRLRAIYRASDDVLRFLANLPYRLKPGTR